MNATLQKTASNGMAKLTTFRAIFALVLREMTSLYGNSPGGYAWAFIEPIGGISMLAIGFAAIMNAPVLGDSFFVFYASGVVPLSLYLDLGTKTMNALIYSKALMAYPRVLWIDALIARFLLTTMTNFLIFIAVMTAGVVISGENITLQPIPILVGVAMLATLGFGVGTLNCIIAHKFEIWRRLWTILTKPLFIMSGVFFLYENLPSHVQSVVWWNPIFHAISLIRSGIYYHYQPTWISYEYPFAFGLCTLAFGLLFMRRYHKY